MKDHCAKLLLFVLMSMMGMNAFAHDIFVKSADGVTIYYNYINEGKELEVTYHGSEFNPNYNAYQGNIIIPEEVSYKNITRKVTSIGEKAFCGCVGLDVVTIPNSVKHICREAFEGSGITEIEISDGAIIHGRAFANCSKLKKVILGEVVFENEWEWFKGSNNIETITINCHEIPRWLFADNRSLVQLTLGNKVETIDEGAFSSCSGLKDITFPNSLINLNGFNNCTGLTSIIIPGNVKIIGYRAFDDCSSLNSVTFSEGIKRIEPIAFGGCTSLKSIELPNSIDSVEADVFNSCYNVSVIILPEGLTYIGPGTFGGCNLVKQINLPPELKIICPNLFWGCENLETVIIPSGVESVNGGAFAKCPNLKDVFCYSLQPPPSRQYFVMDMVTHDPFYETKIEQSTLHVPVQSIDIYKDAEFWNRFGNIVGIDDNTSINIINENKENTQIYDIQGNRIDNVRKGVNIIRTKDGKTKKVVVK